MKEQIIMIIVISLGLGAAIFWHLGRGGKHRK